MVNCEQDCIFLLENLLLKNFSNFYLSINCFKLSYIFNIPNKYFFEFWVKIKSLCMNMFSCSLQKEKEKHLEITICFSRRNFPVPSSPHSRECATSQFWADSFFPCLTYSTQFPKVPWPLGWVFQMAQEANLGRREANFICSSSFCSHKVWILSCVELRGWKIVSSRFVLVITLSSVIWVHYVRFSCH